MIEIVISVAMMLGVSQNGNSVRITKPVLDNIRNISGIDPETLISDDHYRVIHLPSQAIEIVGQEQNGGGRR